MTRCASIGAVKIEAGQMSKPLFIPLRTEYFRQFENGEKQIEYRRYGRGWNERTCLIGKRAILSHGYSGARLEAVIANFRIIAAAEINSTIYDHDTPLIAISLAEIRPLRRQTENRAATEHSHQDALV